MFAEKAKPKEVDKYGHGRVWCSCGAILSDCGCHTNYGIKIQSCDVCLSLCDPPPPPIKKKKNKKKTHKVPPIPSIIDPLDLMSEKQLRKMLMEAKERAEGYAEDTEWMVEQESKNEK